MKKFEKTDDTVTSQTDEQPDGPTTEAGSDNRLSSESSDEQQGDQSFSEFDVQNIRDIARLVVHSHSRRQAGRDFIEEAPGLIASRIAKFVPEKSGPAGFDGWTRVVLRNEWIDRLRRVSRSADAMSIALTGHSTDDTYLSPALVDSGIAAVHQTEVHLSWQEAFSDADRAEIESWTATQVIMLLGLSGLWHKLAKHDATESLWSTCLQKCGIAHFPAEALDGVLDRTRRLQIIAEAMGIQPNSAGKQWNRSKALLLRLNFIQLWAPGLEER